MVGVEARLKVGVGTFSNENVWGDVNGHRGLQSIGLRGLQMRRGLFDC